MTENMITITLTSAERVKVSRQELCLHLANDAVSEPNTDFSVPALRGHLTRFESKSDAEVSEIWDARKHFYLAKIASGTIEYSLAESPFSELAFNPTDISKLPEMQPGHLMSIENDQGDQVIIRRVDLESRITNTDAAMYWDEIIEKFAIDSLPPITNSLMLLLDEGYTPPRKMTAEKLLANWEDTREAFYRRSTHQSFIETLEQKDPEYKRLHSIAFGNGEGLVL